MSLFSYFSLSLFYPPTTFTNATWSLIYILSLYLSKVIAIAYAYAFGGQKLLDKTQKICLKR